MSTDAGAPLRENGRTSHDSGQRWRSVQSGVAAILAGIACAAAAWTIGVGGVLAPEPADLTTPLAESRGAIAVAVQAKYKPAPYVIFPNFWTNGSIAAGKPCATYGLGFGAVTTKRIEARGSQRRCVEYDANAAPPDNAVRPLPPMPMDGEDKDNSKKALVAKTVGIVSVISWPADWTEHNSDADGPAPYPGQPCSDFALFAGETTYKHIQTSRNQTANHRCVPITKPIYANGP